VAIMARYVPEVVMNYDPDAAGQNAMRRSIDLLLAKALRIRILKLSGGLDPDDFVRKEGAEVYRRLLANAPYFWQYLMAEAAHQYDLNEPAMKAAAVHDVVEHLAKIQDGIEQLEVARAVAEGFKVPESAILERLRLTPRPPDIRPVIPKRGVIEPERKLTLAEKQLIHALMQAPEIAKDLRACFEAEFLSEVWSAPVLRNIVHNPGGNVENALEDIQDEQLRKEVRAALLEPFGRISGDEVRASVKRLNDAYHVKKIGEIRELLKQYSGSGGAPAELVQSMERHMRIIAEKSRAGGV